MQNIKKLCLVLISFFAHSQKILASIFGSLKCVFPTCTFSGPKLNCFARGLDKSKGRQILLWYKFSMAENNIETQIQPPEHETYTKKEGRRTPGNLCVDNKWRGSWTEHPQICKTEYVNRDLDLKNSLKLRLTFYNVLWIHGLHEVKWNISSNYIEFNEPGHWIFLRKMPFFMKFEIQRFYLIYASVYIYM